MAEIKRMTIVLASDMAAVVKGAVEDGDYAPSSAVVRDALRDWKAKRALQLPELGALKADIHRGFKHWPRAACGISILNALSSVGGSC